MDMVKTKTKSGKRFYLPYDNDGKVIMPIFEFLKNMVINGKSHNTIRNNCQYLLTFWQYLEDNGWDYIDFIGKAGEKTQKAYDNLTDYKLWLLYPGIHDKVIPINGVEQARKESTVNQMMYSVIEFYTFLATTNMVAEIPFISHRQAITHSNSFLREMTIYKKDKKKSLFSSKVVEEEPEFITEEEFELCWNACTSRRNRIIIGLMYYGGLRVSEVVGLNISDMKEIYKNVIHVVERDDPDNEDAAVKYHSVGTVVINDKLRDEIITYMNEDLHGIDTNYLIVNFKGKNKYGAMTTDNIRDMIDGLAKKVKLNHLHPHMFRHGCAMSMVHADVDIISISGQLRHKNISSTQVYAKMDMRAKVATQKKLAEHRKETFAPYDIDFDEITKYLLESDDNE